MPAIATIRTFLTTVESVEDVHPHLRRVCFAGGDLTEFTSAGPDSFVYVLVAPPGCDHLAIDRDFTWDTHATMPDDIRPVGAYYSVRRFDPAASRLEALFVLHGDDGSGSAWAMRAQAGDAVALWGPRTAYHPPLGTDHFLLVADETGLPAIAAILDQLPTGATAQVVAEVAGIDERHDLPLRDGVDVTWVHRDGAAAGTTRLLIDAVRALPEPRPTTYVWGGGESRAMTAVRTYVRREVGLPQDAVDLVAYWRHPESPTEEEPED